MMGNNNYFFTRNITYRIGLTLAIFGRLSKIWKPISMPTRTNMKRYSTDLCTDLSVGAYRRRTK